MNPSPSKGPKLVTLYIFIIDPKHYPLSAYLYIKYKNICYTGPFSILCSRIASASPRARAEDGAWIWRVRGPTHVGTDDSFLEH